MDFREIYSEEEDQSDLKVDPATRAGLVLDHIFLIAGRDAVELLKAHGFYMGELASRYPELGAIGHSIFFHNFYMQILTLEDPRLFNRYLNRFYEDRQPKSQKIKSGIAFQKGDIIQHDISMTNQYQDCMELSSLLSIIKPISGDTVLYYFLPAFLSFKKFYTPNFVSPLAVHKNGIMSLSNIRVFKNGRLNAAETFFNDQGIINFSSGKDDYFELEFDGGVGGREINLKSELSIVVRF